MSIYDSLNTEQKEAVFYTDGPLLILAGAGSGKTRVLTHRIAYLIEEEQVNPYNIMAITFTNKAAAEMRERVDKLVEYGSESVWVSTFHSSCVRILHRYIDRLGYDNNFTIYDSDDQKNIVRGICKRLNIDTKKLREKTIINEISNAKNELVSVEEFAAKYQSDFTMKQIVDSYREYEKELKSNNALDFDDLLMKTVELFKSNPDVLESYQRRFRYIMVDEYQDTNTAQFQFVKLLADTPERNLCVVGDDDQSIYKFRGANIRNILDFEYYFQDAKVIKLEQNYRSTQNILNAANDVIHHNTGRKDKKLWTNLGDGEKIIFKQFNTGYDEADYVVNDIYNRVADNLTEYKNCAVLYRTNAQSRMFEEKLVAANVPYKLVGGINFYARKEIKDMLSYLKTIANGKDDLAVRRIINVPKRGIGMTTIGKVQQYALEHDISFFEALENAEQIPSIGRAAVKIRPFVELITEMRKKLTSELLISTVLQEIIEQTEYVEMLKEEGEEEALARQENIDELLNKIIDYEDGTETPDLNEFLEEVALVADIDSLDEDTNRVVLMTLHSAKGLEFENVYLAGMEDGLFPSYMTITSDDPMEIEEERRLCYVGITRAMRRLVLTCARQRMVHGEVQYNRPSRFIKEINPELFAGGFSNQAGAHAGNNTEKDNSANVQKNKGASIHNNAVNAFRTKVFDTRQFTVKKADGLEYGEGDRVSHIKFGEGSVVKITEGGRDYEVTVDFDNVGTKKMFASFAKLKKI